MRNVRSKLSYIAVSTLAFVVVAAACDAGGGSVFDGDDSAGPGTGGTNAGGTGSGNGNVGGDFNPVGSGGNTNNDCINDPNVDDDMDGATEMQGDCNDCDPNTGPGAIEVETDRMDPMAEPADEDCDGVVDEPFAECDAGLAIDDGDPLNAARALELCAIATPGGVDWGVLSANYVRANGAPATAGVYSGLIDTFGPNVPPRFGQRMLGLSSGHARSASQPNACGSLSCTVLGGGTAPPGFPQNVPNCPVGSAINDDIGLEVQLRAPTNASGYAFEFTFYTFEYPEWVCDLYNDQFIALVTPPPMGAIGGNISFDSMANPVSVNVAFFEVCAGCTLGTAELQGTGFDVWNDAGATGWLVTQAPIDGGEEFTIRFAIWDTQDALWDSTVMIDNFQWIADSGMPIDVGTVPVPN
jgi:hypothetical protein